MSIHIQNIVLHNDPIITDIEYYIVMKMMWK